jgi:hypothetical protein
LSSEKEIIEEFKTQIEKTHSSWLVQTEVPIGELTADARVVEVDESKVVKGVISYGEAKSESADLRELLTGLGQCAYYIEQSGCPAWLIVHSTQVQRLLGSQKKIDPRIFLYDIDEAKLHATEQIAERMTKSRMKRSQEKTMFKAWERDFTIVTKSPIAITSPQFDKDGQVIFNVGQRVRGIIRLSAQTISGALADSCKFSIYVEPLDILLCNKNDLQFTSKFVTDSSGRSMKREFYEIAPPKTISFRVRSIHPKLTAAIVENLLRQGGMFCGIGDGHSDGFHGRYELQEESK